MRKLLGPLVSSAILGVLLATTVGEARAAFVFEITVSITDNNTSTTTTFGPILSTGPDNTITGAGQQTEFQVNSSTFSTAASGLTLSGLDAKSNNPGSTNGTLKITGVGQVNPGSDHSFTVKITTSETGFTSPSGSTGSLTASDSNTVTSTTSATHTTQDFASYFSLTNTVNDITGPSAIASTIDLSATGLNSNKSGMSPTATTVFPGYVTPYALTNVLTFTIVGNGTGTATANTNSSDQFTGSTVVSTVPEPASVVMFLTSMPLPLIVVGLLRRRPRSAAG